MAYGLSEITAEARAANAARSPAEWRAIIAVSLDEIRQTIRDAKMLADKFVPQDTPVTPVSSCLTGAFVSIASIEHALVWLERAEARLANVHDGKGSG